MAAKDTPPLSPPFGPQQLIRTAQQFMSANPMMSMTAPQVRQFWETQDKILDDFEELTQAWCERRHEANRAALEATKAISGNGASDVTEAMKVMSDWLTKSMERLSMDARDNYEFCAKCVSRMTERGVAAGEELAEISLEQTKRAASAGSASGSEKQARSS